MLDNDSLYAVASMTPGREVDVRMTTLQAIHMKRTNLVLDEDLLEELIRLSGERTYSAAVTRAIQEFVRRARAGRILELAGSGLWEGDLSEMREDDPVGHEDEDRRDGHAAG
jgi:Arc/MetJ family transcription regulator